MEETQDRVLESRKLIEDSEEILAEELEEKSGSEAVQERRELEEAMKKNKRRAYASMPFLTAEALILPSLPLYNRSLEFVGGIALLGSLPVFYGLGNMFAHDKKEEQLGRLKAKYEDSYIIEDEEGMLELTGLMEMTSTLSADFMDYGFRDLDFPEWYEGFIEDLNTIYDEVRGFLHFDEKGNYRLEVCSEYGREMELYGELEEMAEESLEEVEDKGEIEPLNEVELEAA